METYLGIENIFCAESGQYSFFRSREVRITHHSMEARLHRRREGIGISTSHSITRSS